MQINQRADLHAGAGGRIQHPGRQNNDHAGRHLNVNNPATGTLLTVLLSNMAPIQWMPAVMHPDLLPDMGRMNRRLHWAAKPGSSPAPSVAASAPRSCIPSFRHAYAALGISMFGRTRFAGLVPCSFILIISPGIHRSTA